MEPEGTPLIVEGMSDGEFKYYVLALVRRELGLGGLDRFISLWGDSGDYTRDRHLWQDHLTIEDIRRDLTVWQESEAQSLRETKGQD